MIILWIDPWTTTVWYAIVEKNWHKKTLIDYWVILTTPKMSFADKILEIIWDLTQLIEKYSPEIIESSLVQLGIIGFFSMATEGAMFDWSGVYFKDIVHAPANFIIVGYASFMVMMATGRFIGDIVKPK